MRYEDIYPGIDVRFHTTGGQLQYDFLVDPGADYRQIRLRYDGAESLFMNANGELVIQTTCGYIREVMPHVYQPGTSQCRILDASYVIHSQNTVGISLSESYNPQTLVVIDPVLDFSSFVGGTEDDWGYDIAVDNEGNVYLAGLTTSPDFPTANPLDSTFGGGSTVPPYDVFVMKFSPLGDSLLYSTYLGGSNADWVRGISVDASGAAYVVGYTRSVAFPTVNAYDSTNYLQQKMFIAKLSPSGDSLLYSTFLGGSGADYGMDIAIDEDGNAYVVGRTSSSDFPMKHALDSTFAGGPSESPYDVVVAKIGASGDSLLYSTYLGGSGADYATCIAVDNGGAAFIGGTTFSPDFPILNAYHSIHHGGSDPQYPDAFLSRIHPHGDSLICSTFLGGSHGVYIYGVAVSGSGGVWATGYTYSADFPTVGAFDSTLNNGSLPLYADAFIVKFADCASLTFSTFLGGAHIDRAMAIAVDSEGRAHVTGVTYSSDVPTVAPITHCLESLSNVFVVAVAANGDSLLYATYLGGTSSDWGNGIAAGSTQDMWVTGYTKSPDVPMRNPYDSTLNGSVDAFIARLGRGWLCECTCHADPRCDGTILDILDVVDIANVAFRGFPSPLDLGCPWKRTDMDCSCATDVIDIVKAANVAFRNESPEDNFCDPCAPLAR